MHQMYKKKDSATSSVHSTLPYLNTSISWGNPSENIVHRASMMSDSLSLKMDTTKPISNSKQISFQDQDSSSTQSTGQSYTEVASSGDDNPSKQILFSPQSNVCEETQRKGFGTNTNKSGSTTGFTNIQFGPSQATNYSFHYTDPHFGGLLAASYLQQGPICNPQMMSLVQGRVPLPVELTENEPVFVNAKQFHAIMRRRQQRAKLEAQNKLIKARKPYLHESRHVHALKRPRGSGGRFLNTKKLQESEQVAVTDQEHGNLGQLKKGNLFRFEGQMLQKNKDRGSTTSGSDITSTSDGVDVFGHSEFQFSGCPIQVNRGIHGQSNDLHHFSVHI